MNNESFITIAESKNHYDDFVHFMDATTDALRIDGKKRHDYYLGRNGEKLEEDVLQWMKAKAKDFRFNPDSILPTKKQHFPDIISNNYFGVEVKSTKENLWTSTGSSIVESLRDEDIKKVFMMFGILSKDNVDFRCKPYEKCLSDIHVTHSPRYSINMNLSDGDETIFDKMNMQYDEFRQLGETQIDKVRDYYRGIYKSKNAKTMPWWIGEEVQDLRLFSDLDLGMKNSIVTMCYVLFPEILGRDQDKFRKPALWMCTRYSIICTNIRDLFTAGGTGNIYVNDELRWENVPKVICNMLPVLGKIVELFSDRDKISKDINNFALYTTGDTFSIEEWKNAADGSMRKTLGGMCADLKIDLLLNLSYNSHKSVDGKCCFFLYE